MLVNNGIISFDLDRLPDDHADDLLLSICEVLVPSSNQFDLDPHATLELNRYIPGPLLRTSRLFRYHNVGSAAN